MKLYIDLETTRSYEIQASEAEIAEAFKSQGLERQDGESLADLLHRTEGTYPAELALASLVGETSEVDSGETWSLSDWDDSDEEEE